MVRLTWDGVSKNPALSPDGRLVTYRSARMDPKHMDLYVQQVGGGTAIRLTEGATSILNPVFSADSSRIYYTSMSRPAGIYEVPALGGESRLVIPNGLAVHPSPDGKWLAYLESANTAPAEGPGTVGRLRIRPVEGGEPRALMTESRISAAWMAWSHDSRQLLVGGAGMDRQGRFYRVPVDGSAPIALAPGAPERFRKLGFANLNLSRLVAWFPDNTVAISVRFGDATNLVRVSLEPGSSEEPTAITQAPLENVDFHISGRQVAFSHRDMRQEIWALPADANAGRLLEPATGKTSVIAASPGIDLVAPRLSPDGRWLLFSRFRRREKFQLLVAPFHGDRPPIPESEWRPVAYPRHPRLLVARRPVYLLRAVPPTSGPPAPPSCASPSIRPPEPSWDNPTEFFRLDGYLSGGALTNTLCANRNRIFMTVGQGTGDVWMTGLP